MKQTISLKENLHQLFIRRDNLIAGPFEISENNYFFDTKNHELYFNDGTLWKESNLEINENPEDLISIKFKNNKCDCLSCTMTRKLLSKGVNTQLINKIDVIEDLLINTYNCLIEKTSNFSELNIQEQINVLARNLNLLSEIEGINKFNITTKQIFDNIENLQKNEKPKENLKNPIIFSFNPSSDNKLMYNMFIDKFNNSLLSEKIDENQKISDDSIAQWLNFQLTSFINKNILYEISYKKLLKMKEKSFIVFMEKTKIEFNKLQYNEKGMQIKIKLT